VATEKKPERRPVDDPHALDKFASLTRRLVAVPKKEIDREAKKYERRRKRG
jgi:hypothetical protein